MKVLILHDRLLPEATEDERDVLVQAAAVESALGSLGHTFDRLAIRDDPDCIAEDLRHAEPDVVFNLVESLLGSEDKAFLVPALLEQLSIPYTGVRAREMDFLADKPAMKALLRRVGIATPPWFDPFGYPPTPPGARPPFPGRFILKSATDHASRGLDDDSVVTASSVAELKAMIRKRREHSGATGGRYFAESFIEGRELNVALLTEGATLGVEVLPVAEIVFEDFPAGKPHIVGYQAKWQDASFESVHTPRRFDFGESDRFLIERLIMISQSIWTGLGLRGYARVDYRVGADGIPQVLEINANPCLSPDAGFAAAIARCGMTFAEAVERMLADALTPDRTETMEEV